MSNLPATRELLDSYYSLLEEREYIEHTPEQLEELNVALASIESQMTHKIGNIRDFNLELTRREESITAEKKTLQEEIKRLSARIDMLGKIKERIDTLAISMIETIGIVNKNGIPVVQTDIANYSVEQRWEHLEITDQSKIPTDCIKIIQELDNRKIRQLVIDADGETEFGLVRKKKGLRIR